MGHSGGVDEEFRNITTVRVEESKANKASSVGGAECHNSLSLR